MASNLTPQIAQNLAYRSMTVGAPTSEFDHYGGYDAVMAMANSSGVQATPKWIDSYERQQGLGESEYTTRNKAAFSPGGALYGRTDGGSWDGATPGGGYAPAAKPGGAANPGSTAGTSGATNQTNPYLAPTGVTTGSSGPVNTGSSNINPNVGLIASAITGNVNPGSGILNSNAQLTPQKAAQAQLPPGATPKTEGAMGYSTGDASTKAGVENWYNALTGQSRVVVPGGFTAPDANWKKL